mmetsp:Transcript_23539/g.76581  ORF Transcript_23539/g.76581 Transcript_23539/m.76581 type:complete len:219 (+) Transcript_23539:2288-2944(+)
MLGGSGESPSSLSRRCAAENSSALRRSTARWRAFSDSRSRMRFCDDSISFLSPPSSLVALSFASACFSPAVLSLRRSMSCCARIRATSDSRAVVLACAFIRCFSSRVASCSLYWRFKAWSCVCTLRSFSSYCPRITRFSFSLRATEESTSCLSLRSSSTSDSFERFSCSSCSNLCSYCCERVRACSSLRSRHEMSSSFSLMLCESSESCRSIFCLFTA